MKREWTVEFILKWSHRNGVSGADPALNEYCANRGLQWRRDYQDIVTIDYAYNEDGTPLEDPTPWCSGCGSMTQAGCHCGPIAEND